MSSRFSRMRASASLPCSARRACAFAWSALARCCNAAGTAAFAFPDVFAIRGKSSVEGAPRST